MTYESEGIQSCNGTLYIDHVKFYTLEQGVYNHTKNTLTRRCDKLPIRVSNVLGSYFPIAL